MVEGYAAIFDSPSEYIGWTEYIKKGAITQETI
nr:MAG TPA: prohead serine protease [Caudoviricetes sp.]